MSRLCAKTSYPSVVPIGSRVRAALGSRLCARGRISAFDIISMAILIHGNADCTKVEDTVLRSAKCGENYQEMFGLDVGVEIMARNDFGKPALHEQLSL